jgi:hypothetical protein
VLDTKIKPFVGDKIKASLGEADEDLVDFVLENIRDRKRPEDIIDGLDPVSCISLSHVDTANIPGIGRRGCSSHCAAMASTRFRISGASCRIGLGDNDGLTWGETCRWRQIERTGGMSQKCMQYSVSLTRRPAEPIFLRWISPLNERDGTCVLTSDMQMLGAP